MNHGMAAMFFQQGSFYFFKLKDLTLYTKFLLRGVFQPTFNIPYILSVEYTKTQQSKKADTVNFALL